MVQSDIDSNSSGELTVLISPNLVAALADNEAVTVNKPSFTVYLENNEIMYSTDASGLYTISFDVKRLLANAKKFINSLQTQVSSTATKTAFLVELNLSSQLD